MELADGTCRWNLQMELADGTCRWNLQMELADGTCRWNLQIDSWIGFELDDRNGYPNCKESYIAELRLINSEAI
jgi:hypothetical protein